jgi:hypothetical protein
MEPFVEDATEDGMYGRYAKATDGAKTQRYGGLKSPKHILSKNTE